MPSGLSSSSLSAQAALATRKTLDGQLRRNEWDHDGWWDGTNSRVDTSPPIRAEPSL